MLVMYLLSLTDTYINFLVTFSPKLQVLSLFKVEW